MAILCFFIERRRVKDVSIDVCVCVCVCLYGEVEVKIFINLLVRGRECSAVKIFVQLNVIVTNLKF